MAPATSKLSGRASFTFPDFNRFQFGRWFVVCALEMQTIAIGWQLYAITGRPMTLGLVGLFQFLPGLILFLPAGYVADHFNRRNLIIACYVGFAICAALLLFFSRRDAQSVNAIYFVSALIGLVRAFYGP